MAAWKRLSVMLYVYCLSCCDLDTNTTLHMTILAFLIPCYQAWGGVKLGDKKILGTQDEGLKFVFSNIQGRFSGKPEKLY